MKNNQSVKNLGSSLMGIFISAALAGCMSQNPYPDSGVITSSPPQAPHGVTPAYVIDAPTTIDFQENKAGTFNVVTLVPTGAPVLKISGLPAGASFDVSKGVFTWTPDANAGHDPTHPELFEKDYKLTFTLSSTVDALTVFTSGSLLRVHGVAQPMDMADSAQYDVQEGGMLNATFSVKSPDFPQGPFSLQFTQLPDGATVTQSDQDPTVYNLTFMPTYNFVTTQNYTSSDNTGNLVKTIHLTATATGPRATKIQKTWDLTVHDVRQYPAVSVGDNLSFSYAADFAFYAEDINGEAPPQVTFDTPAFGTVTVQQADRRAEFGRISASSQQNPVQVAVVHWANIPQAQLNLQQSLTLHACANAGGSQIAPCTTKVVHMMFTGKLYNAPNFDELGWKVGEVKYIRMGSTLNVPMAVTDPDSTSGVAPTVTVNPVSLQSDVSYANGTLTITPTSSGTKVFELTSTSAFGVQAVESFTMVVLPKDWGSVMLLGQSKADPEIQASLPFLIDAQLVSPSELNNDAEFIQRKSAFVTTSSLNASLQPHELGALLGKLESQLGRVVVSTPLTAKFPIPSLPSDLNLTGRYSKLQLANKPVLNALSLVPTAYSMWAASNKPVKLNQVLTAESNDPMTFTVNPNGACVVMMNLTDGTVSIPAAVECTVDNLHKVLFVGFEWGDMAFDQTDANLGQTWLQGWLAQPGQLTSQLQGSN